MALKQFVIVWVLPLILVPCYTIYKWIRGIATTVDNDADQANVLDIFTELYHKRMAKRKEELILNTVTRVSDDLSRPVRVLEVGCGSKANFPFYPPETKVTCLEPNPKCEVFVRNYAKQFDEVTLEAFHVGCGENMEVIASNSFDVVVITLTLCTVDDVDETLKEVIRVLRPGGKFIFMEHVAASDNLLLLFIQTLMSRMWSSAHHGCRITRRLGDSIQNAGFRHVQMDSFSADELLAPTPMIGGAGLVLPHISGIATK